MSFDIPEPWKVALFVGAVVALLSAIVVQIGVARTKTTLGRTRDRVGLRRHRAVVEKLDAIHADIKHSASDGWVQLPQASAEEMRGLANRQGVRRGLSDLLGLSSIVQDPIPPPILPEVGGLRLETEEEYRARTGKSFDA